MQRYKLNDVVRQIKISEYFDHPENEIFVTVSGRGKGVSRRNIVEGKTPVPFSGYRVNSGQLIYSRIGAVDGAFGIIPKALDHAVVSKDFPVFEINENIMQKEYLLYFLCSEFFYNKVGRQSSGATLKRLKEDVFVNAEIHIPPLKEQKRIVGVLSNIKEIVTQKQLQLQQLDNLTKARFVEMFGGKDIDVVSIGDVVELINGRAFKPTDWTAAGLPIIRIQNLNDKAASFNYYDGAYDKKNYVQKGELLFSWSGTPGTSFGAFIWDRGPGILNQHIFRVIPRIDLDLNYLRYALNDQLEIIISKAHGGVGLQHITKGELEKVLIPSPNKKQQLGFSAFVTQVDKSKFAIEHVSTPPGRSS